MRISRIGGLIAAEEAAMPLTRTRSISAIRKIVTSYQRAGVFPIVVVTGADGKAIQKRLTSCGLIFLQREDETLAEDSDSAWLGIKYLYGKCDRVMYAPVSVPLFSPLTLSALIQSEGEIAVPNCHGQSGYPVLISEGGILELLSHQESGSLRDAVKNCSVRRTMVEVEDEGVLIDIHNEKELLAQVQKYDQAILGASLHLSLEREKPFFSERTKLLLFLLADTENMLESCAYSGIAYSKAWDMINLVEQNLGFRVVERVRGGRAGGSTKLTEKGRQLLTAYQSFEEYIYQIVREEYQKRFVNTKIIP